MKTIIKTLVLTFAILFACDIYSQQIVIPDLYLRFEEDLTNSGSNDSVIIDTDSSTFQYVPSTISCLENEHGILMDSSDNNKIKISGLDFVDEWTIHFSFKYYGSTTEPVLIFRRGFGGNFSIYLEGNQIIFDNGTELPGQYYPNDWNHITIVKDNVETKLYNTTSDGSSQPLCWGAVSSNIENPDPFIIDNSNYSELEFDELFIYGSAFDETNAFKLTSQNYFYISNSLLDAEINIGDSTEFDIEFYYPSGSYNFLNDLDCEANWFKDDNLIASTQSQGYWPWHNLLTIENASPADAGIYHVEITKKLLGFELRTDTSNYATLDVLTDIVERNNPDIITNKSNKIFVNTNEKFVGNVYDISGRLISTFNNKFTEVSKTGIYIVVVETNNETFKKKIFLENR